MKKQPEFELQKQITKYLEIQYPKVLFLSDTIASVKLTEQQGARNKAIQKKGFKVPDLLILEPRNEFSGLLIELKNESPYKLNGEIKASQKDHLKEQERYLKILSEKGYKTAFSWGFEMTRALIDDYLK